MDHYENKIHPHLGYVLREWPWNQKKVQASTRVGRQAARTVVSVDVV